MCKPELACRGEAQVGWGVLTSWKYVGGVTVCFAAHSLKCHILSFKTVVEKLCKFHIIKDERFASEMEGRTNFSRRPSSLTAWPGWLFCFILYLCVCVVLIYCIFMRINLDLTDPSPHILRQIYASGVAWKRYGSVAIGYYSMFSVLVRIHCGYW